MGNVSYSAHISNGKSAITSKKALAGVAKHNLRKYKSADYSSDNIRLISGTTDLFQDVKRVYHREFDDAVKEYNRYLIICLNACKSYCRSSRLRMRSYTLMKPVRICMW